MHQDPFGQRQRVPPNLTQKFLYFVSHVLRVPANQLVGEQGEAAVDSFYEWLARKARDDVKIPITKLRNVKDTEWAKKSDYKHDPLYSVGHNQDEYVHELSRIRPSQTTTSKIKDKLLDLHGLSGHVPELPVVAPELPFNISPFILNPLWQDAPVHTVVENIKYKKLREGIPYASKTRTGTASDATQGWNYMPNTYSSQAVGHEVFVLN